MCVWVNVHVWDNQWHVHGCASRVQLFDIFKHAKRSKVASVIEGYETVSTGYAIELLSCSDQVEISFITPAFGDRHSLACLGVAQSAHFWN